MRRLRGVFGISREGRRRRWGDSMSARALYWVICRLE